MKYIIISTDGDSMVYFVLDEAADRLRDHTASAFVIHGCIQTLMRSLIAWAVLFPMMRRILSST